MSEVAPMSTTNTPALAPNAQSTPPGAQAQQPPAEPQAQVIDPAMNNSMVPHVMCNVRIIPEFAAARNAPQLVTCMGNLPVAYAFAATPDPAPPFGEEGQAGQQPAPEYPGFERLPDGSYRPIAPQPGA